MSDGLFNVAMAAIPLICAILTYIIFPYIKNSINLKELEQYKFISDISMANGDIATGESAIEKGDAYSGFTFINPPCINSKNNSIFNILAFLII